MSRWMRHAARRTALPAFIIAAAIAVSGCATNPATGKRQISLVSPSKELDMGREADPAVQAEYGLYGDSTVQHYVDSIGQKLAAVSHLPNLAWHFRVLDSPVVNAFAIPGGYVYITRGILAYLNSEAQLAGILGHEIGHVTARHSAQQMTRAQIAGLGLIVGTLFVDAFRPYSGLAQEGLGLLFLKYSRDNESQADELGVGYAVKAGYDPREIPATYAMLKRVSERQGDRLPAFLSTHPDPGDREIRTSQLAQAALQGGGRNTVVGGPQYRWRIERLVFGDDPRGGFFVGNRFYQPDLAIQMIFPDGWKTSNQPSAVTATSQELGAAMELSLQFSKDSTATPEGFARALVEEQKILDAAGRSENFRDFPAWIGSMLVRTESGRKELLAGLVRYRPGQFLQVLASTRSQSDRAAEQVLAAIRSIAALGDTTMLGVTSDRIHVATVERDSDFPAAVGGLGAQSLSIEDTAILNNLRVTGQLSRGAPLKIVRKGRHP